MSYEDDLKELMKGERINLPESATPLSDDWTTENVPQDMNNLIDSDNLLQWMNRPRHDFLDKLRTKFLNGPTGFGV